MTTTDTTHAHRWSRPTPGVGAWECDGCGSTTDTPDATPGATTILAILASADGPMTGEQIAARLSALLPSTAYAPEATGAALADLVASGLVIRQGHPVVYVKGTVASAAIAHAHHVVAKRTKAADQALDDWNVANREVAVLEMLLSGARERRESARVHRTRAVEALALAEANLADLTR